MIFTTHDFQIMNTVSNRIIELRPDGIVDRMILFEEYVKEMRVRDMVKSSGESADFYGLGK